MIDAYLLCCYDTAGSNVAVCYVELALFVYLETDFTVVYFEGFYLL